MFGCHVDTACGPSEHWLETELPSAWSWEAKREGLQAEKGQGWAADTAWGRMGGGREGGTWKWGWITDSS